MSVEATSWALQQQAVTDPAARSVLFGLANHANHEGRHAFPSVDLLCRYTGLGRRTVITKLKLLQERGLVRRGNQKVAAAIIERADRRPTVYDPALGTGLEPIDLGDEQTPDQPQKRGAGNAPRNNSRDAADAPRDANGVQMTTERGARAAPEPSVTLNPSLSGAGESAGDDHPPADPFDRFRGFDDSGQPIDNAARSMTEDWEPDADAVVTLLSKRMANDAAHDLLRDHGVDALEKFRTKYLAQPGRQYESRIWQRHFADFLAAWQRNLARSQANNQTSGGSHANRQQRPRQYQSAAEARRAAESGGQPVGETFDGDWTPGRG